MVHRRALMVEHGLTSVPRNGPAMNVPDRVQLPAARSEAGTAGSSTGMRGGNRSDS